MGVKGLWKLIRERAPDCIESVRARDLRGKVVAVDASFVITQWRTALANVPLVDDHLHAVLRKTVSLLRHGIEPIFVFDGIQPAEKRETIARRSGSLARVPTRQEAVACQDLLSKLGIAWVAAPGEADVVCSDLTKKGVASAVLSEDLDMFAHGATCVLRQWSHRGGVRVKTQTLLAHLALTQEQFVDLCLFLGTDYVPTVPGVGPKRAWDAVQAGKRPEDFVPQGDWAQARALFGTPVQYTLIHSQGDPTTWSKIWDHLSIEPNHRQGLESVLSSRRPRPPREI